MSIFRDKYLSYRVYGCSMSSKPTSAPKRRRRSPFKIKHTHRARKPSILRQFVRTVKRELPDAVLTIGLAAPAFTATGGGQSAAQDIGRSVGVGGSKQGLSQLKYVPSDAIRSYGTLWYYPVGGVVGAKVLKWAFKGGR